MACGRRGPTLGCGAPFGTETSALSRPFLHAARRLRMVPWEEDPRCRACTRCCAGSVDTQGRTPHWRHDNGRGAGCCEEASAAECATLAPLPSEAGKARARLPPSTLVQTRTIHGSGPKMDPRSISWQRPQGEGEEEAEEEALPFEGWDNGTSRKRLAIWLLAPGRPFLETCTWMWHACEEAMRRARATAR